MTTAPTPGWTGHVAVDSALVMLDRIDCSPDDDARIDAITSTLRQLHAAYQALQTENERLRMELVAEARAAAEQQLRADQLAQQHRMQAQMHAQATQQLAELEARKPLPMSDEQIERLREQAFSTNNPFCPCDSKTMRKAVRAAERAHGIKET